jgi:ABC-type amino acid transport substrate-binding protein
VRFLLLVVLCLSSLALSQTSPAMILQTSPANLPPIPTQPKPSTPPVAPKPVTPPVVPKPSTVPTTPATSTTQPSKTAQAIRTRGRLILAVDPQFAPFALRDEKNKLVGFDVDLARFVAGQLGVPLEVQSVGFGGLLNAVKASRADLAGSGLQMQKRKDVLYSNVYFDNTQVFVVRSGNPSKFIYPAPDLTGKQLGVRANTIGFLAAFQQLVPLGAKMSVFDSNKKALEALQTGKIESLILDLPTFTAYRGRRVPIDRVAGSFVQEQYVYGLPANSDLLPFLNSTLALWQQNGGYQKALEKWLLDR